MAGRGRVDDSFANLLQTRLWFAVAVGLAAQPWCSFRFSEVTLLKVPKYEVFRVSISVIVFGLGYMLHVCLYMYIYVYLSLYVCICFYTYIYIFLRMCWDPYIGSLHSKPGG